MPTDLDKEGSIITASQRALAWSKANPERRKEIQLKYRKSEKYDISRRNAAYLREYGISFVDYQNLLETQKHVCAICGQPEKHKSKSSQRNIKSLCVDHNHITGNVRKLLCSSCNTIIGMCNENIQVLYNTINYLKEHS